MSILNFDGGNAKILKWSGFYIERVWNVAVCKICSGSRNTGKSVKAGKLSTLEYALCR
jgi:hypothetical protein